MAPFLVGGGTPPTYAVLTGMRLRPASLPIAQLWWVAGSDTRHNCAIEGFG